MIAQTNIDENALMKTFLAPLFILTVVPALHSQEQPRASVARSIHVAEVASLKVSSDKSTYVAGDVMKITVEVPSDGFLILYGVNADGSTVMLLPNPWQRDNSVKTGSHVFPGRDARYHFPLSLEAGQAKVKESVHAVFSPVQFEKDAIEEIFKSKGFVSLGITTSAQRSTRGLVPTARKDALNAELKYELLK